VLRTQGSGDRKATLLGSGEVLDAERNEPTLLLRELLDAPAVVRGNQIGHEAALGVVETEADTTPVERAPDAR
jgi:hypothetical protein